MSESAFGIVMGIALLLTGIGFLVLTLAGRWSGAPATAKEAVPDPRQSRAERRLRSEAKGGLRAALLHDVAVRPGSVEDRAKDVNVGLAPWPSAG